MKRITEQLWTIEDVAEFCRVKVSVVRYWVQQREIPFIKLGKFYRFDPKEVKEWVEEKKQTNKFCIYDALKTIK